MSTAASNNSAEALEPLASDSQRLLAIGGLLLVACGMLFGDVFALFILHPNNASIGGALYAASGLIPAGDVEGILAQFQSIGGFLENRGTKVDAHSHMIHLGYIGLLLAVLQPWVALPSKARYSAAALFIASAALMPPAIFSIHYLGLTFSPFEHIGWASIVADLAGALLAIAVFIQLWGILRHVGGQGNPLAKPIYLSAGNDASRVMLIGGLTLLLCGFLYGAGMAAYSRIAGAPAEVDILKAIVSHAAASQQALLGEDFAQLGRLQMLRGISIAVHAHINEMGILLVLMSMVQGFIQYSRTNRQRWARLATVSAFGLPLGIQLEVPLGVVGSVVADLSGFALIVCLVAMLFGLLRHTGATDSARGEDA
ncbi:MAG: hypothetical protein HOC23_16780 [Halieaceae bacterium]|nr:hypothetical protein [Halieaceae bacterium]